MTRLCRHGGCKPRQVLHSWSNGRRLYLELHRHRWQCRDCGHTFTEGKELVHPRSRLTRQAETEALWQLKDRSFSQVTRDLRVAYGTLHELLVKYPSLKGFYWAKEKIRELYRQESRKEASKLLDNIIFNLKSSDDGELIRWGNTLKHWREPILNHFDNRTTNGFTEGCNTKIKMRKRISYGLKNIEVYWRKMLLGFVPSRSCFHTI